MNSRRLPPAARHRPAVRVSRRELLRLAAVCGLGTAAGSVLAAGAPPAAHAASRGGVWRMAIPGNPTAYPITIPGKLVDILVDKTMFSTLVKYELRGGAIHVVPDLAESWTSNAALTEYTFKLRRGARWHDGRPLTADDVKFTIEATLNPKVNAGMAGVVSAISQVTAVDPATVRFTLKYPYASLPVMLGYNIAIVPKHLLEGQDLNQPVSFIQHPVGSGPFKFKTFVQDSHLEVEANKDYFGGAPLLDGIVFKVIPDGNARLAQLKAGDIDFTVIDPPQVAAVQGNPGLEVRRAPQVNYYFFAINHDRPKFADPRVRQALCYAIDKQAIVKNILRGDGRVATGPINPLLGAYYNPNIEAYPYSLEKAQALLGEAGWRKGADGVLASASGEKFTLLFNGPKGYPVMEQVVTYAQQQYQRLGAAVTLDIVDWPVHLQKYHDRQYDLLMEWWITPPNADLYDHYYSGSSNNWWGYKNPALDRMLVAARSEPDEPKRIAMYHEIQAGIARDVPVIYLYYPPELQAVSTRTQGLPVIGYRDALTWMSKVWLRS
ncbi:MAG TPA: ABC transporter substrate-binding protein [bacterium]|nr:ABC transporter substrate-binding protein [bacterium]